MDCPLIDFSSPEQKRDDNLMIPECLGASSMNRSVKYFFTEEESNPFDFVNCQVAANRAAENDPFEMVFNDAMQCKKLKCDPEIELSTVGKNGTAPQCDGAPIHKEASPSDATHFDVKVTKPVHDNASVLKGESPRNATVMKTSVDDIHDTPEAACSDSNQQYYGSEELSLLNLDDIPAPDSLLNSTIDMSCFLDDTLAANSCDSASESDVSLKVSDQHQAKFASIKTGSNNSGDSLKTAFKSEEELKLSAQRQIEKLICKAQLEAHNDRRDSLLRHSRSVTAPLSYSPKRMLLLSPKDFSKGFSDLGSESVLDTETMIPSDFCSFLSTNIDEKFGKLNLYNELKFKDDFEASRSLLQKISKIQEQNEMQSSLQALSKESLSCLKFKQWSQNELNKFDLSLSDLTPFKKSCSEGSGYRTLSHDMHPSTLEDSTLPCKAGNSVAVESLKQDLISTPSSIQTRLEKGARRRSLSAEPETTKVSPTSASPISPVLLTLPLCEDAVRNLSLCSKLSPVSTRTVVKPDDGTGDTSKLKAKNPNQPKLFLRKPAFQSKAQPRMAPMKATAPVQNMTRVRSSPSAATKRPDISQTRRSVAGKLILKEQCSKLESSLNSRSSLRMPQSPRHHSVNGSLKNVPYQGNKPSTRLPSPRRSTGATNDTMQCKKRTEFVKEKNSQLPAPSSSFASSPRISRSSSPCLKSGGNGRVLTDINMCQTSWKSPKRRLTQLDPPRRHRSLLNEKENL